MSARMTGSLNLLNSVKPVQAVTCMRPPEWSTHSSHDRAQEEIYHPCFCIGTSIPRDRSMCLSFLFRPSRALRVEGRGSGGCERRLSGFPAGRLPIPRSLRRRSDPKVKKSFPELASMPWYSYSPLSRGNGRSTAWRRSLQLRR